MCSLVFYLVQKTGVLRRHGHTAMCPPCAGLGLLPSPSSPPASYLSLTVLNTAVCISPSSDLSVASDFEFDSFEVPKSLPRLVERIPKATRDHAARVFEGCLRDVVTRERLSTWTRLMAFPSCLRLSPRTGRRHRLTTQIAVQFLSSCVTPHRDSRVPVGFDQQAINLASKKLSKGGVRDAVKILSSDASYVTPN